VVTERREKPGPDHVLTWRQRKILQVIRDSVEKRGYPPSMIEISEAVGFTNVSSVSYQVATLERKGYLHRDGRRPRTMEVRLPGHPAVRTGQRPGAGAGRPRGGLDIPSQGPAYVPLVRRIPPGGPVLAGQQAEGTFPLPRQLVGEGTLFMLEMTGDSMADAAIADGDWLVVRQQEDAESGEIVAAMYGGEATVRRLARGDDHDWLMPHNPAYAPLPADDAAILGKVVAVVRRVRSPLEVARTPTDGAAAPQPCHEELHTPCACLVRARPERPSPVTAVTPVLHARPASQLCLAERRCDARFARNAGAPNKQCRICPISRCGLTAAGTPVPALSAGPGPPVRRGISHHGPPQARSIPAAPRCRLLRWPRCGRRRRACGKCVPGACPLSSGCSRGGARSRHRSAPQ
jgi:repressor LexA